MHGCLLLLKVEVRPKGKFNRDKILIPELFATQVESGDSTGLKEDLGLTEIMFRNRDANGVLICFCFSLAALCVTLDCALTTLGPAGGLVFDLSEVLTA